MDSSWNTSENKYIPIYQPSFNVDTVRTRKMLWWKILLRNFFRTYMIVVFYKVATQILRVKNSWTPLKSTIMFRILPLTCNSRFLKLMALWSHLAQGYLEECVKNVLHLFRRTKYWFYIFQSSESSEWKRINCHQNW